MENDILEELNDVGYTGPMLEDGCLEKALAGGAKSLEYTSLIAWIGNELKTYCHLDEHINAITTPDDSSSFLLEVSSFLKELGCAYGCLTEGHMSDRLNTRFSRCLLVDYLLSELHAARMIRANKPDTKNLEVHVSESTTASDLKSLLISLQFAKPPAQVTPAMLFSKVENKLKELLVKAPTELIGSPLFTGLLSPTQWQQLEDLHKELQQEYHIRRQMLIKRLDVTIQSFQWSDRMRNQEDKIVTMFRPRRQAMVLEPKVQLADLLAAREDLAILEKTSSAMVRRNTQSSVNKVIIGNVPDRGGRPNEQQPPPPEMPSWEKQRQQGGGGGGGRGGGFQGGRGGGGDRGRGGRVQGGWSQGTQGQQDNRQGGWNQDRGGFQDQGSGVGYRGGRGGRGGNRGGYQQR